MIALFTDFGLANPYIGQIHAAIYAHNSNIKIVDLFHHAPAYDVKRSAYLLNALSRYLPPASVVLGIVDPGVGTDRQAIAVQTKGKWFVGPDNGLFSLLINGDPNAAIYEIVTPLVPESKTFLGRDLFAPCSALIAKGDLDSALASTELERSMTRDFALLWPKNLAEIIFIDDYGNACTGIEAKPRLRKHRLRVNYASLPYRRTFASAQIGQPFWTINSMGLIEVCANQADAAKMLSLSIGDSVELR